MASNEVVIVAAARTPLGAFQGSLSSLSAPELGAASIRGALARGDIAADTIEQVFMGEVLQGGVGQAPARQAALGAGLAQSVPCTTVNKVCGSGMQAVVSGAQSILTGDAEVVVAGGMESMTNAPYYLPRARAGYRMGHGEVVDGMVHDGLWDPYDGKHMGSCGDLCARSESISREDQDAFAIESTERAQRAQAAGKFAEEITPVTVRTRKGSTDVSEDDGPKNARPEKIPLLAPAFGKEGTVTAGNASSINDGAAALVLASRARAKAEGWTPLARIVGWASTARKPVEFPIAPADAIRRLLANSSLGVEDVDLWEINEAFAVVALANARRLDLALDRVNVRGGAVCLGHPIGASGARLLVTLAAAMADRGSSIGVASLCIGGGEGIAMAIERLG